MTRVPRLVLPIFLVLFSLLSFNVWIENFAQAASVEPGSVVYFSDEGASSSRATNTSHCVGEVKRIIKGDTETALVFLLSRRGMPVKGETLYQPTSTLSPAVKSQSGFSTGGSVRDSEGQNGIIHRIFANDIAEVDFTSAPTIGGRHGFTYSRLDHLRSFDPVHGDSKHPNGWKLGQTVYFAISKTTVEGSNGPNILTIDLGSLPSVGKITGVSEDGLEVTIQVERRNGVNLVSPEPVKRPLTEVSREIDAYTGRGMNLKRGESVVHSSVLGIKQYEFRGHVERVFENGIVEAAIESRNGKPYSGKHFEYLFAQHWKPASGSLQSADKKVGGIDIIEDDPTHKYLALWSVERALKKPDLSYLGMLEQTLYDRAKRHCLDKKLKGLFAMPETIELTQEEPVFFSKHWNTVIGRLAKPWSFRDNSGGVEGISSGIFYSIIFPRNSNFGA